MKTCKTSVVRLIAFVSICIFLSGIPIASQAQNQLVNHTLDTGPGSLRQAILDANSNPGPDTISFALAGSPPFSITPLTVLPGFTDSMTVIDGTTQPGYQAGDIRIDCGSLPAWTRGLYVTQSASYFEMYGIYMLDGPYVGIQIDAARASVIGAPGKGNIISGFAEHGILVAAHRSLGLSIQANIIGLEPDSLTPRANDKTGIYIAPFSGTIGGIFQVGGSRAAGEGNLIGNNGFAQLALGARAIVQGNIMGTDVSMTQNFGNGWNVVPGFNLNCVSLTNGADSCMIGGSSEDFGNILAHSPGNAVLVQSQTQATITYNTMIACGGSSSSFGGVSVHSSTGVRISHNSMRCNAEGIVHLFGGNNSKASPVIATATELSIIGTASPGDSVEVFVHDTSGCMGATCQGAIFLGGTRTNPMGQWLLNGYFPYALAEVTATATDNSGNTSEFASCRVIDAVLEAPQDSLVLQQKLVDDIGLYPNPTQGKCFIQIPRPISLKNARLTLFSLTHQQKMQRIDFEKDESGNLIEIDLEGLTPGLYLLRLTSEELDWQTKLVLK